MKDERKMLLLKYGYRIINTQHVVVYFNNNIGLTQMFIIAPHYCVI